MLTSLAIRRWHAVHKWTSLICTLFLLLLCLTGLPLIFYEEIEHLTGRHPVPATPSGPADTFSRYRNLDDIIAQALNARPGEVVQYVSFDEHEPIVYVTSGVSPDAPDEDSFVQPFDWATGAAIAAPPFDEGIMWFLYRLHADLYLGLGGALFMGVMGALFVASTVSGIVVYAPYMRKLDFGTIRRSRHPRLTWLDLHNLLGIVTLAWTMVVGLTGIINTLSVPLTDLWQKDQLAEMVAPYRDQPLIARLGSAQAAFSTALVAAPHMRPSFIAYPGTPYSSRHHYAVFMTGNTPLTAKLYTPVLIDAEIGTLIEMRAMPWYMQTLFLSQPLHFGDYGGLPLKFAWAALDLMTIAVLLSGIYLWLKRHRNAPAAATP